VKVVLALIAYLAAGALEIVPLLKRRQRREAGLTAALVLAGAIYSAGLLGGWPLPNPVHLIETLFHPLSARLGLR
jgi:hypothetical protein